MMHIVTESKHITTQNLASTETTPVGTKALGASSLSRLGNDLFFFIYLNQEKPPYTPGDVLSITPQVL